VTLERARHSERPWSDFGALRLRGILTAATSPVPTPIVAKELPLLCTRRCRQRGGIISKLAFLIFAVIFVFVVFLLRHPLLRAAGNFWVVNDPLQRSDAIFVLSDDNYHGDRAAHAAELFKAGWAPRIVASGRFIRSYTTVADLTQRDLTQDGVPQQAITSVTHHAQDTLDEMKILSEFSQSKHFTRVIIVTSNYHTRRARLLANRIFTASIGVLMEAAPDVEYDPDNWWRTRQGIKIFTHEAVGYFVNLWEVRPLSGSHSASELLFTPALANDR
jgi:uncharacterized SAM-binding protein YcdF (DUF218 family)